MAGPVLMHQSRVKVAEVRAEGRLRPVTEAGVASLIASITETGVMKDAIHVRKKRDSQLYLLAGGHRLEAARRLGWDEIEAKVWTEVTDDWARLIEIDDNLAGAEMNALDSAVFLATRKAVYERLHPETKAEAFRGNQHTGKLAADIMSFATATAEKFNISERHVRRMIAAGASLGPDEVSRLRTAPKAVGFACFYGPSGYGKTKAAVWNAQETRSYWVEVKSTWGRKKLVEMILRNMGISPGRTIGDMVEQIGDQLSRSGRPLLIDEADLVARDGMIGVIRDIYESSQGTVILIGEESLPQTLRRWERVHNRMLDWVPAQPADLREVGLLAQLKCPDLTIASEVLQIVLERSQARARRIVVNLRQIAEHALTAGATVIDMDEAQKITFFSGEAPAPRRDV